MGRCMRREKREETREREREREGSINSMYFWGPKEKKCVLFFLVTVQDMTDDTPTAAFFYAFIAAYFVGRSVS